MDEYKFEYQHRSIKDAVFALTCLAYPYVKDTSIVDNLKADCDNEIAQYEDLKHRYAETLEEKEQLKFEYHDLQNKYDYEHNVLEIIKKKKVNIDSLLYYFAQKVSDDQVRHWYNNYACPDQDERQLTETEFNLIKGWLKKES